VSTHNDPTTFGSPTFFADWLAELDRALRNGDKRRERRARLFLRRGLNAR